MPTLLFARLSPQGPPETPSPPSLSRVSRLCLVVLHLQVGRRGALEAGAEVSARGGRWRGVLGDFPGLRA
jgi:hypothetical protein